MATSDSFASLLASVPLCRLSSAAPSVGGASPLVMTPCGNSPGQSVPAGAYAGFIGRSAGNGQCVALVQAVQPGIGFTVKWSRGPAVRGNTSLQPGTVIATFAANGRYTNATDGSSHSAIYLGQNAQGVQVLDQWRGQPAAVRTIPWVNPAGGEADRGSRYYVVNAS